MASIILMLRAQGAATLNGERVDFKPTWQLQRAGLAFSVGHVIVAFGSHCDNNDYTGDSHCGLWSWKLGVSPSSYWEKKKEYIWKGRWMSGFCTARIDAVCILFKYIRIYAEGERFPNLMWASDVTYCPVTSNLNRLHNAVSDTLMLASWCCWLRRLFVTWLLDLKCTASCEICPLVCGAMKTCKMIYRVVKICTWYAESWRYIH